VHAVVTVAIPTLNAGDGFHETLAAIQGQRLLEGRELELLICDSGSDDATRAAAIAHGARVIEISRQQFSHGDTRNLLMAQARGTYVAFLTQDGVPADDRWLEQLLVGFALAPEVGLVFGPYRPRPGASLSVCRELTEWFASFSPDGTPRIDALTPQQRRELAPRDFLGHRGFFTDANGCIARCAWERAPFRAVSYAEDHLLAQDMLRAGFAKVYLPDAPVEHSHDYAPQEWLRRSFDEARAVEEIYGVVPGGGLREAVRSVRGNVGADRRWLREQTGYDLHGPEQLVGLARSTIHYGARGAGTVLGAHAKRLPAGVSAKLSLERRR
jgi:rhamnosyltransferase